MPHFVYMILVILVQIPRTSIWFHCSRSNLNLSGCAQVWAGSKRNQCSSVPKSWNTEGIKCYFLPLRCNHCLAFNWSISKQNLWDLFDYPICGSSSEIDLVPLDIFFLLKRFCFLLIMNFVYSFLMLYYVAFMWLETLSWIFNGFLSEIPSLPFPVSMSKL